MQQRCHSPNPLENTVPSCRAWTKNFRQLRPKVSESPLIRRKPRFSGVGKAGAAFGNSGDVNQSSQRRASLLRTAAVPRRYMKHSSAAHSSRGSQLPAQHLRNANTRDRLNDVRGPRVKRLSSVGSGGGEIRTRETLACLPVFKTGAFNHSATPPGIGPIPRPPYYTAFRTPVRAPRPTAAAAACRNVVCTTICRPL